MKSFCCLLFFLLFSSCFEDKSRVMVDGKMEPPAPDESKNNETIGGIDSNNDGVRDDIERWINRKFPGEEDYNKRMAWKQKAGAIQSVLIDSQSKAQAIEMQYKDSESSDCLAHIYIHVYNDTSNNMFSIEKELWSLTLNTELRLKRHSFADQNFRGMSYTSPPTSKMSELCKFKIKRSI